MTMHLVCLQFVAGGPMVTGEWADGATARRTWRDWVGLYGSDEKVVIRLAENADGGERVLMAWKRGHAVEASSDGPVATESYIHTSTHRHSGTTARRHCTDAPGSTPPVDLRPPRPLVYDPAPSPEGGLHAHAEPARGLRSSG
ncbi:hypothetical protein [Streptomyces sp. NPDC001816]|uniref:hypothetical protein n=1 Tax=Streptomyces sp. NPDC001816 TaxID=3364612 RepID=UPI00368BE960